MASPVARNNPGSPCPPSYIAIANEIDPDLRDANSVNTISAESRLAVRKLLLVSGVAIAFMTMEFVGGYIASSLAVISDAIHMLTDVLGFAISLTAIWINTKSPPHRLTFGFHRVEIVGAVISMLVIWVLTGVLVSEAVDRFQELTKTDAPEIADGFTMFIIALVGLASNAVMMMTLGGHGHGHSRGFGHGHSHGGAISHTHLHHHDDDHDHSDGYAHEHDYEHDHDHANQRSHNHDHGHGNRHDHGNCHDHEHEHKKTTKGSCMRATKFENLNIQAAYLHVIGDLLQSVGVAIAGALIWWNPSWQLADPIMTVVFSVLVVCTTVPTMKQSLHVLMEGTPGGIDLEHIKRGLGACDTVVAVHDLHIWSLSTSKPALAVHLVSDDHDAALASAQRYLIGRGITHTTIQIERPSAQYPQACGEICA